MNHLKHSIHDMCELIIPHILNGDVECYEYVHTEEESSYMVDRIKRTIYEKEDVGVYIARTADTYDEDYDEYYDGYTFIYTKGIPEEDIPNMEKAIKQILKHLILINERRGE